MIKSLPSTYHGVLFRSRLEARWAAFFDMFGLQWVYEPEGFETPTGNYLPDFLLPTLNAYVEVKPASGLADNIAIDFVHRETGKDFLVLDSPLVECRAFPILTHTWPSPPDETIWRDTSWCSTAKYLRGGPNADEHRFFIDIGTDHAVPAHSVPCTWCGGSGHGRAHIEIAAARSLRFENGVAG